MKIEKKSLYNVGDKIILHLCSEVMRCTVTDVAYRSKEFCYTCSTPLGPMTVEEQYIFSKDDTEAV